jgi:hypothetical protein
MEETLGKAGSMLLKLVAQYWTDERTIMIAGKDHALDATSFRGAALMENTEVEVQAGSQFPKSKAAKQAAIQDMLNLYFQYQGNQPMNKRMLGKVLEDMEAGALSKLFGDISVSESQINRENQEMSQSVVLNVNPYDEHEVHIEGHEEYQRGPTYKKLGPEVNAIMESHVNEHRQQLLAAMGPMVAPQAAPGAPQNGAGGPPGGQPTPTPTGGAANGQ